MDQKTLQRARAALGANMLSRLYEECQKAGGCPTRALVRIGGTARFHCPHCLTSHDGGLAIDAPTPRRLA